MKTRGLLSGDNRASFTDLIHVLKTPPVRRA